MQYLLRSFRLKFFIIVSLLIVLFAIITRVNVRTSSDTPIHDIVYSNFASYLLSTVKEQVALASNFKQQVQSLQMRVRKKFSWMLKNIFQTSVNLNPWCGLAIRPVHSNWTC
jgi:conjugal transfer/entry exclusion protein